MRNKYNSPYLTIDIAICDKFKDQVLLAKKKDEIGYRFVGGFVDSIDESIKSAAKRECSEETGGNLELINFKIIGESKIDDWRYRDSKEKLFTVFFKCDYINGDFKASDDIVHLEWISFSKLRFIEFQKEHIVLRELLCVNLNLPIS